MSDGATVQDVAQAVERRIVYQKRRLFADALPEGLPSRRELEARQRELEDEAENLIVKVQLLAAGHDADAGPGERRAWLTRVGQWLDECVQAANALLETCHEDEDKAREAWIEAMTQGRQALENMGIEFPEDSKRDWFAGMAPVVVTCKLLPHSQKAGDALDAARLRRKTVLAWESNARGRGAYCDEERKRLGGQMIQAL